MKKMIALAMGIVICLGLVACGGDDAGDTSSISNTTPTVGKIDVTIESAKMTQQDGKDVVVVTYSFKNDTQKSLSFKLSAMCVVKQGEQQLASAIISNSDLYNSQLATTKIEPGKDTKAQLAYELLDKTTPLDIECKRLSGEDKTSITKTLNLE